MDSRFSQPAGRARDAFVLINRARALLVLASLATLLVPFVVIALCYLKSRPVASLLGLIRGTTFIVFEVSHRSLEYFVVDAKWAHEFFTTAWDHQAILQRFARWNEILQGWTFPQTLSYFFASCAFAVATWEDGRRGGWYYLAPVAYGLNALRLLGRLLSTYAGQDWLQGLNDRWYFPSVLAVNGLLVAWVFLLAREARSGAAVNPSPASVRGVSSG